MTAHAHAKAKAKADPTAGESKSRGEAAPANPLWSRLTLGGAVLQGKLRIGAVDDPAEREADRVAEAVVGGGKVQRCACEDEERVQRAPARALPSTLGAGGPGGLSAATESRVTALRGGGQPLSPAQRTYFEPHFGDLSSVRLHTSGAAAEAAREVSARAFTVGRDIAFSRGEYQPESPEGRRLMAHELVHTVQQGAASSIRRKPKTAEEADELHDPIVEQYRREEGLPLSGLDPLTGRPVGPSRGQIKYSPWPGDVATPATKPSLTGVPDVLPLDACGKVVPGMDPAIAEPIRDCITHSRFVNYAFQAATNIAKVPSPYAPAISNAYLTVLADVIKAGKGAGPTASKAKTFAVTNLTAAIGGGVALPVPSFDLKFFRNPGGANGASFGNGIELNEESMAVFNKNAVDIERTMYHEGFHWLSGVVGENNRQVRAGLTKGSVVRPELDYATVGVFESEFRAAAEPIWTEILASVTVQPGNTFNLSASALSGVQWLKISNEVLSRVEEAVYLRLREGQGFSRRFDLPDLSQPWLTTSDYWDSGVFFVRRELQNFLTTNTPRIHQVLLPIVQKVQRKFLQGRARP